MRSLSFGREWSYYKSVVKEDHHHSDLKKKKIFHLKNGLEPLTKILYCYCSVTKSCPVLPCDPMN